MESDHPVSDWRTPLRRLKVGHHIRNRNGQIGVVTWIGRNAYMYRLGKRDLNGKRSIGLHKLGPDDLTPLDDGWINPTDDQ